MYYLNRYFSDFITKNYSSLLFQKRRSHEERLFNLEKYFEMKYIELNILVQTKQSKYSLVRNKNWECVQL